VTSKAEGPAHSPPREFIQVDPVRFNVANMAIQVDSDSGAAVL
jgi:hypothetical protein